MSRARPAVAFDVSRGYSRLDPPPSASELDEFYRVAYYASAGGRRAPDLARLSADDERTIREREWRSATVYPDVLHFVAELGVEGGAALDIGCGTGEFVAHLDDMTGGVWKASGVELSPDAVDQAVARGLDVFRGESGDLDRHHDGRYDLVTMFNVLEHLLEPEAALADAYRLLRPGGVLVVQVPNDFSVVQDASRAYLGVEPWWIAVPDHVNYFTFETLAATVNRCGFAARHRFCTFPMELFLITGLDYVSQPELGADAHRQRCAFELAIQPDVRRCLYEQFAEAGIGRNCILISIRD